MPFSSSLQAFIAESPLDRPHIARFVADAAASIPAGTRVLDAGAGSAPYRELFGHCEYVTSDWAQSMHAEAREADIVAPIESLPVDAGSFGAALATQVLEHVARPGAALQELHRILAPGARLWLTTPFLWELHEEPNDFFRYTAYGMTQLLQDAGFTDVQTVAFGGWFSAVGQLLRNFGSITGWDRDAGIVKRGLAWLVARSGRPLARLDRLDRRRGLPLVYGWSARRP
jgi:SAM-dependent methyltransferase